MLGRVPTLDLPYLYNIADAMIIHLKSLEINNSTIPHKIYGYMAAKTNYWSHKRRCSK